MGGSITLSLVNEKARVKLEAFMREDSQIRYKIDIEVGRLMTTQYGTEYPLGARFYGSEDTIKNTIDLFRFIANALEEMHKNLKEGDIIKWVSQS